VQRGALGRRLRRGSRHRDPKRRALGWCLRRGDKLSRARRRSRPTRAGCALRWRFLKVSSRLRARLKTRRLRVLRMWSPWLWWCGPVLRGHRGQRQLELRRNRRSALSGEGAGLARLRGGSVRAGARGQLVEGRRAAGTAVEVQVPLQEVGGLGRGRVEGLVLRVVAHGSMRRRDSRVSKKTYLCLHRSAQQTVEVPKDRQRRQGRCLGAENEGPQGDAHGSSST